MREVKRQEHGIVDTPAVHGVREAAVVTTTFKDLNSPAHYIVTIHDQVHYQGGSAEDATLAVLEFLPEADAVEPWPDEPPPRIDNTLPPEEGEGLDKPPPGTDPPLSRVVLESMTVSQLEEHATARDILIPAGPKAAIVDAILEHDRR